MGFFSNLFKRGPDAGELLAQGAIVVDVRTPQEFKSAHVKNAKNIPLNEVSGRIQEIRKWEKPVVFCCASGMRSGRATSMGKGAGIPCANGGSWSNTERLKK